MQHYINPSPLNYEMRTARESIEQARMKLAFYEEYMGIVDHLCRRAAEAMEPSRMVRLPRMWYCTEYAQRARMWTKDNVRPTIWVNGQNAVLNIQREAQDENDRPQVLTGEGLIYVNSDPSWEAWKRWSNIIVDQFFQGMRLVREHFGSPAMKDVSVVKTEYSWQSLSMMYETTVPVHTSTRQFPMPIRYAGETYTHQTVGFRLVFKLELPNPPEGVTTMNGCRVEEEEVVETTRRKKKRIICGE